MVYAQPTGLLAPPSFNPRKMITKETSTTVLVFAFDLLAHYTRCLRLAELLPDDYHFVFQASDYDEVVRRQGFRTFTCQRLPEKDLISHGCREDVMNWPRADLEQVMLAQCAAIERYQPAFIIGDMSPTLSMAAERTSTYFVSVVNAYLSRHYDAPFIMPDCLPNDVPPFYRNRLTDREGFMAVARSQKEFRFLRRRYGLTKKLNLALELEGDQTWICDTSALHPLRKNLPPEVQEIGPLQFFPRNLPDHESGKTRPGRKTILVTMGSSGNYEWLWKLEADCFSKYDFLVCGRTSDRALPDHVRYVPFADLNNLMRRSSLLICHGGNGSLYQALAAGKPALCVPSFFEQRFNADCIVKNGWGEILTGEPAPQALLNAIDRLADTGLPGVARHIHDWQNRQPRLLRQLTNQIKFLTASQLSAMAITH